MKKLLVIIISAVAALLLCGAAAGELPQTYDLRDVGGVSYMNPNVRDQGSTGACWAFAVTTAVESNLMRNGVGGERAQLSVLHLLYGAYNPTTDPLGLCSGDYNYVAGFNKTMLTSGGNNRMATFVLSRWLGPAPESAAPFSEAYYMLGSEYPDFAATELDVAHLRRAVWLSADEPGDRDAIKSCLMEYGAASVSMYKTDSGFHVMESGAHQGEVVCALSGMLGTNHDVTLVGWDDGFKKENFGDNQPKADGAWLFRNSLSMSGQYYFWMSYEETSLGLAVFYDMGGKAYQHNYQYDGTATDMYRCVLNCSRIAQANVFTSAQNETLEAVGFVVPENENVKYSIEIFKNPTELPALYSDAPVSVKSGTTTTRGYYTIALDQPVALEAGDVFSVVITMEDPTGKDLAYACDKSGSYGGEIYFVSDAAERQSFIKYYGEYGPQWFDLNDPDDPYRPTGNLRIKAFTTESGWTRPENPAASFTGGELAMSWDGVESASGYEIYIYSAEQDAFALFAETAEPAFTGLTEVAPGSTAYFKVRAELGGGGYSDYSAAVSVRRPAAKPVNALGTADSTIALGVGDTVELEISISPTGADDKTLAYISSSPSVASVDKNGVVTGNSEGSATITVIPRSRAYDHTSMSVTVNVSCPDDGGEYQIISAGASSLTLRNNRGGSSCLVVVCSFKDGKFDAMSRISCDGVAVGASRTVSVSMPEGWDALRFFILDPEDASPLAEPKELLPAC